LIGIIIVGVFFVGIGVSYSIFTSTTVSIQMTDGEHIKSMIYDPEIHEVMMNMMMDDEEHYRQMFNDMTTTPMLKHQFTEKLMETLDSDSELRMHVMAHLMQDEDFINQMQSSSP
jgi:hypothetical protein